MTHAGRLFLVLSVLACAATGSPAGERAKSDPQAGRADHTRAITLLRGKKFEESLKVYGGILASDPKDKLALYNSACAYALMGRKTEALDYLQRSIDAGFLRIEHIVRDPDLKSLRKEKGYKAILKKFDAPLREGRSPGPGSIRRILKEPRFHRFIPAYLPRHYSPELTPATAGLLDHKDAALRRAAVVSLIHQNAASKKIRGRVGGLLGDPDPEVREAAGEYLSWHGTAGALDALRTAAAKEADPYALSSMRAAVKLIGLRAKGPAAPAPRKAGKEPPEPESYADAWLLLRTNPTEQVRRQALEAYRLREKFEPRLRYTGKSLEGKPARERNARLLLAAQLFAFPGTARSRDAWRPEKVPVAGSFMAPVRDYFNPKRRSFGVQTGKAGTVFGNSVHVGDDVAWQVDHRAVVAIGAGAVRRVSHVQSWGYIVIVEHKLPGGKFVCSLYSHLAPSICVKPGEVVEKGRKIGSVGRSHTWENGGYWSHLHFGLHEGPYLSSHPVGRTLSYTLKNGAEAEGVVVKRGDPFATVKVTYKGESVNFEVKQEADWICGYISPDYWKGGKHGWLDPQKFIGERLKDKRGEKGRAGGKPAGEKPAKKTAA